MSIFQHIWNPIKKKKLKQMKSKVKILHVANQLLLIVYILLYVHNKRPGIEPAK